MLPGDSLAGGALPFPHTHRFGATRTGWRQPQHAERRTKYCEADTDQKGYPRTVRRIAPKEQRYQCRADCLAQQPCCA